MKILERFFKKHKNHNIQLHGPVLNVDDLFLNKIEKQILAYQDNQISWSTLMETLLQERMILPCIDPNLTCPLVLSKSDMNNLIVFLTNEQRMSFLSQHYDQITGTIEISIYKYLQKIVTYNRIIINPGWKHELIIEREFIQKILSKSGSSV